jgi:hypothetical protein
MIVACDGAWDCRDCNANAIPDGCEPLIDAPAFADVLLDLVSDPVLTCQSDLNGDGRTDGADIQTYVDGLLNP